MHKRLQQAIRNVNNDTWINSTKGATLDEIVSKAIATATTIPEELPIRNEIGTSPDNIATSIEEQNRKSYNPTQQGTADKRSF